MSDLINVDTDILLSSVERLKRVKNRVVNIDRELNSINKQYDLLTLLGFQYNRLQQNNYILNANINYLMKLINDIDTITNSLNRIDPLNYAPPKSIVDIIQEVFKGDRYGEIIAMYIATIQKFFEDKKDVFFELTGYFSFAELISNGVGFINDEIFDDIGSVVKLMEYIRDKKIDLGVFDDIMDGADHLDNILEIYNSIRRGDLAGIGENVYDEFGEILKMIDKQDSVSASAAHAVLIKAIINIPTRFIKNIEKVVDGELTTSGEVYWDTVVEGIGSAVVDFAKPVYNLTTVVAYPMVDDLLENIFGYDLSAEYEKLSGKTGLEAVFEVQKELWVDTIYEEGIRQPGVKLLNGFYEGSEKLVSTCWKKVTSIF